ncbi:MAG: iron-regulated protein, partial [Burkholderiaceae bacterium]|nr:iron-regulated protein [Burkholderiaceae bacterium]
MLAAYAELAWVRYGDARDAAIRLDEAIDAFLAAPDAASLAAARDAWRAAREAYLVTEVFRFYGGPIDNDDDGPEGLINAWPLDEAYIDGVLGDPTTGIINDPAVALSAETLVGLNEQGGEENIATGYHAIEFLLWGQDHDPDGPGDRPFTDFLTDETATAP